MTQEQLKAYFERIDYTPGDESAEEIFKKIHIGHITHIPFENLDPYRNIAVSLNEDDLFDKLVTRRRGGYCFEMNTLLAAVLRELGFDLKRVSARLGGPGRGFGGYLHCAAIVNIGEKRYIADVGFGGGGFVEPVELVYDVVQDVIGGTFRVRKDERFGIVVQWQRSSMDELADYMAIHDVEALPQDFEIGSHYTNFHPMSGFRRFLMLALPTLDGRIGLSDEGLRITKNGESELIPLNGVDEINAACLKYFGLDAPLTEYHPPVVNN